MNRTRVSVVMANYNYGRYLAAAVESVLAQSFRELELIVVDDGSTDDSLAVLERYTGDGRVRVLSANHVGQARAKNTGIAAATGSFIAFLDADDLWRPEKLERQLALLDANPNIGVVYARRTLIDETGRPVPFRQPQLHRGDVRSKMFQNNFVCFSSAVVRRAVFEHLGGFDPTHDLAIDYDLWLRVASHYRFDYVDETLVEYRVGHGNLSRRVGERLKTVLRIMDRHLRQRGGADRVAPGLLRQSLAETYCHLALALRPFDPRQSGRWFVRALAQSPAYPPAWRGLLGLCLPAAVRQLLRFGHNWEKAYLSPENDPKNI